MSDVVALATELLSIESTTGREREAVDFASRWLVSHGWNVSLQEVEPGRSNLWAKRRGGGVTLSTHLDTVPPFIPPRLEGSRLSDRDVERLLSRLQMQSFTTRDEQEVAGYAEVMERVLSP